MREKWTAFPVPESALDTTVFETGNLGEGAAIYCIFPFYREHNTDSEHVLPQVKIVIYFNMYKNVQNAGKQYAIDLLTNLLEPHKKYLK